MKCPICGGEKLTFIPNTQTKTRGIASWLTWLLIAFVTFGVGLIFLVFMLATNKKTITTTRAICNNCGHQWDV